MAHEETPNTPADLVVNAFTATAVLSILQERGWISADASAQQNAWCEHAAALLGPFAADRNALAELLGLVFHYDAMEVVRDVETHVVMSRYAARDVIRQVAAAVFARDELTADRFQKIVLGLKDGLGVRGRELFDPLRLALTGRVGDGKLDRVILLVDEAAKAGFVMKVKTARERILEFCSVLD
jgi:hypothetical protein